MKKIITFLVAMLMIFSITACEETNRRSSKDDSSESSDESNNLNTSSGGSAEGYPYVISDADELFRFAEEYNSYKLPQDISVKLGADIKVNDIADVYTELTAETLDGYRMWIPVKSFYGTFDGDGNTISGLVCCMETNEKDYVDHPSALFGFVYDGGMVKNVTVKESFLTSNTNNYTAGICGALRDGGTIENCHNYAKVLGSTSSGGVVASNAGGIIKDCTNYADMTNIETGSSKGLGGICGFHNSDYESQTTGWIINCVNYGAISGCFGSTVGGIAGYSRGFIENCINKGDIKNEGASAGGIAGSNTNNGEHEIGNIKNCINYGNVECKRAAGGIAAANSFSEDIELKYGIQNCINYGNVTSEYESGGICAYINGGVVSQCANLGDVSAFSSEHFGGVAGGICMRDSENTIFKDCYNAGDVTASKEASGLCDRICAQWINCYSAGLLTSESKGAYGLAREADIYSDYVKIENCYFIGEIQGDSTSNYLIKDMYDDDYGSNGYICGSCYLNRDLASQSSWYLGFDFDNVWTIDPSSEYTYPILRNMPTDFTEEN